MFFFFSCAGSVKPESEELEEGEMAEEDVTEKPILSPGINSALVRLFEHHRMKVPAQLLLL
jgi:hypothetical protein